MIFSFFLRCTKNKSIPVCVCMYVCVCVWGGGEGGIHVCVRVSHIICSDRLLANYLT